MKKIKNARNNFWGPCQVLNIPYHFEWLYIQSWQKNRKNQKKSKKIKKIKKLKIFGTISGALARSLIYIDIYIYITAIYLKTGVPENPLPDGP